MKRFIFSMALLTFFGAALVSCNNDDEAEIGEAGNKLEGINATWVLVEAEIQDDNDINKQTRSVFDYYGAGVPPEIAFNSNSFSFTTTANGKRNFFGSGGTWAFDDNDYPTMITLNDDLLGIIEVQMTATIRPQDSRLKLNYARDCGGDVYATYFFEYERK